jgi:hypothetical protein
VIAILGALVIAAPDLKGGMAPRGNDAAWNLLAVSAAVTAAIYCHRSHPSQIAWHLGLRGSRLLGGVRDGCR